MLLFLLYFFIRGHESCCIMIDSVLILCKSNNILYCTEKEKEQSCTGLQNHGNVCALSLTTTADKCNYTIYKKKCSIKKKLDLGQLVKQIKKS
uniref:Putative secreted protein n=1 Tax=Ixodes ricinus TaxID=34613 RepID=A0A6B0UE94_IXORI